MSASVTVWRRRALLVLIVALGGGCALPPPSGSPEGAAASVPAEPTTTQAPVTTAAAVCRGPDVDWSILPAAGEHYGKAWNERDPEARLALLEEAWADDGSFVDPSLERPVVGRDALSANIGEFWVGQAGAYFEPLPWVEGDGHHGHLRMPWRLCDGAGTVILEGEDIAVLAADGRIQEATGFFATP